MHRYGSADRWPEARDIDRTIPTRPIVRRQQSPTTALAFVLAAEAQDPRRPFVKAQEGKKLFTLRRQEATQATEVILFGNSHRVSQEVPKVLPETSWSHWVGCSDVLYPPRVFQKRPLDHHHIIHGAPRLHRTRGTVRQYCSPPDSKTQAVLPAH